MVKDRKEERDLQLLISHSKLLVTNVIKIKCPLYSLHCYIPRSTSLFVTMSTQQEITTMRYHV